MAFLIMPNLKKRMRDRTQLLLDHAITRCGSVGVCSSASQFSPPRLVFATPLWGRKPSVASAGDVRNARIGVDLKLAVTAAEHVLYGREILLVEIDVFPKLLSVGG
jgi:hypothetical protein